MSERLHTVERQDPSELFPTLEDWAARQGGLPRVFRNPISPSNSLVVHVYDEHPDPEHRFLSGAIVDTDLSDEVITDPTKLEYLAIPTRDPETGVWKNRVVAMPSFMDRRVHGDVCAARSGRAYDAIKSQKGYVALLERFKTAGYVEYKYGINPQTNRLVLRPLSAIRPARLLVEEA